MPRRKRTPEELERKAPRRDHFVLSLFGLYTKSGADPNQTVLYKNNRPIRAVIFMFSLLYSHQMKGYFSWFL